MNTLNFFVTADYPTGNPLDNQCGPANNVECRGWDSDQVDEFTRQRTKLIVALSGLNADVIGLNELENSTGVEPLDSIVSGMPGYAYINTGTIGTDAIKVGMIYRSAVVTPVGCSPRRLIRASSIPRAAHHLRRPSRSLPLVSALPWLSTTSNPKVQIVIASVTRTLAMARATAARPAAPRQKPWWTGSPPTQPAAVIPTSSSWAT
jgi:hypothetical protein